MSAGKHQRRQRKKKRTNATTRQKGTQKPCAPLRQKQSARTRRAAFCLLRQSQDEPGEHVGPANFAHPANCAKSAIRARRVSSNPRGQTGFSRAARSCVACVPRCGAATLWGLPAWVRIPQVSMLATAPRLRHAASRRQHKKPANTSPNTCFPSRSQRSGWRPGLAAPAGPTSARDARSKNALPACPQGSRVAALVICPFGFCGRYVGLGVGRAGGE